MEIAATCGKKRLVWYCQQDQQTRKMLPSFYQTHLQQQLTRVQYIVLSLLLALITEHKQVSLEAPADVFPLCIKFESRRRKLQRFLVLPQLNFGNIWFPIVADWLSTYCQMETVLTPCN